MAKKKLTVEEQVDKIRLNLYEQTKHMTDREISEFYRKSFELVAKEYNIKTANLPIVRTMPNG